MPYPDLEDYLSRFEEAYYRQGQADVAEYLPPTHHPRFQEIGVELIRSDMELSWEKNPRRCLEDYVKAFPTILSENRYLEQVAFEEYRLSTQSGIPVSKIQYETRFGLRTYHWPDLPRTPAEHFADTMKIDVLPTLPDADGAASEKGRATNRIGSSNLLNVITVESRLHRRLRFISLTCTLLLVYMEVLKFMNPEQKVGLFLDDPMLGALNLSSLVACACISAYLWVRPIVSLAQLRIFELSLFGLILLELSMGLYSDLFHDHELAEPLNDDHALFHYASSWSMPYFALIIAYGTLIPSSWARCTIIVTVMAVTPIAICIPAAVMEGGMHATFIQSFLIQMIVWMGMAAAIAIYGVHRLETLERRFLKSGKLGKYRLIKQLGIGGMGSIYLAEDTLLQRQCAVKLMLQHKSTDGEMFSRFEREVSVLSAISHPNIVEIYDVGHTPEGVFYYVMEFLEGENLEIRVRQNGPFSPNEVIEVFRQIGRALRQVHRSELVHRDIKPANIFSCPDEKVTTFKLLDFGLVRSTALLAANEHLTMLGAIIGTPAFMSPEQASGDQPDIRSDIYSLGAVAYYLLSGRPPFEKNTVVETLSAHLHEQPKPFNDASPDVPEFLAQVVFRCLSKKQDDRFQSMDELLESLTGDS